MNRYEKNSILTYDQQRGLIDALALVSQRPNEALRISEVTKYRCCILFQAHWWQDTDRPPRFQFRICKETLCDITVRDLYESNEICIPFSSDNRICTFRHGAVNENLVQLVNPQKILPHFYEFARQFGHIHYSIKELAAIEDKIKFGLALKIREGAWHGDAEKLLEEFNETIPKRGRTYKVELENILCGTKMEDSIQKSVEILRNAAKFAWGEKQSQQQQEPPRKWWQRRTEQ